MTCSGRPADPGHVAQDLVVRELAALGEVRREQLLHQRSSARSPRGLCEAVGVERAAQAHPLEVEGQTDLPPQCGEPPWPARTWAALSPYLAATASSIDRARRRGAGVELERPVHHRDLVAVLEGAAAASSREARAHTTGRRSPTTPRSASPSTLGPVLLGPILGGRHHRPAGGTVDRLPG